jgi:TctA family transporter
VAFRQSLMISRGDFGIFIERPVSATLLAASAAALLWPLVKLLRRKKADASPQPAARA